MGHEEELKNEGNALFAQGRWQEAANLYTKALSVKLRYVVAWSNRAACYIHLENWEQGGKDAEQGLYFLDADAPDEQNALRVKLLWRIAVCQRQLRKDPTAAVRRGLELDPGNAKLLEEKAQLSSRSSQLAAAEEVDVRIEVLPTLPAEFQERPAQAARDSSPPRAGQGVQIFTAPPRPLTHFGVRQATRAVSGAAYDFWEELDPAELRRALARTGIEPQTLDFLAHLAAARPGPKADQLLQAAAACPLYETAKIMVDVPGVTLP